MRYLYYPGCSLKGTAVDYEESFLALASPLGIEIKEVEDWQCCGASVAKSVSKELSESLPARTLVKADKEEMDLLMPCSSCYQVHLQIVQKAREDTALVQRLSLGRIPKVKHLLEVLAVDVGAEAITRQVMSPLKGIRALPYYGCLITRPFPLGEESQENPKAMEGLIEATGAQPVSFPYKVDCCGGTLILSREKVALKLCGTILNEAKRLSPDCIVVACPLCHFMLDAKQRAVERESGEKINLPVLYITQLLGVALGLDYGKLGLQRALTSSKPLLQRIK
ncbi:MAG: CoB--CoM heterodisulfide reductase iron-sulfur subunit B family protein [Nitrospirae bacterium]|nr:CoB--CoM heterodisulfide reductase iron-sulfur subunit B family protein [Nitrospirota bacterium]